MSSEARDGGVRYAVYFAPPADSPLARFGARWLGRDAESGRMIEQPPVEGIDPRRLARITASPRRYGFHATLRAPFEPTAGCGEPELIAALSAAASAVPAFVAPRLVLADLDGFVALVLATPSPEMDALHAACLEAMEAVRAAPSAALLARRRATGLTARQEDHLQRWGYPYVLSEFRFHMTLTERLEPGERRHAMDRLRPLVAPLTDTPLAVDEICLFHQPAVDRPFRIVRRAPLAG